MACSIRWPGLIGHLYMDTQLEYFRSFLFSTVLGISQDVKLWDGYDNMVCVTQNDALFTLLDFRVRLKTVP